LCYQGYRKDAAHATTRFPPALTKPRSAQVPLHNLWDHLSPKTQQAVFNALTKMLDQALPVTNREQSDE
jgi:hypothetical protein